ncbi:hypothetical protein BH10ACT11_BH10ACT11_15850 [soil metagenome]
MIATLATVIDTKALGETVLAALLAGIGVAITVSLAILGVTASVEASRDHKRLEAGAYAALGIFGFLATAAAIVFGIIVMAAK